MLPSEVACGKRADPCLASRDRLESARQMRLTRSYTPPGEREGETGAQVPGREGGQRVARSCCGWPPTLQQGQAPVWRSLQVGNVDYFLVN